MKEGNIPKDNARPRPVILCVLDGWGYRPEPENNAIELARTPNYDRLIASCPHGLLSASGAEVGLPDGQMGNSEVGHTNIGAGRVVLQDLPRIDAALADGSLKANPGLAELVARLRRSGGACHLMGLMSPGGIHSHQAHLQALARHLSDKGVPVAVHVFLDGRDTLPASGREYMRDFLAEVDDLTNVQVVTVAGRYYAMDRDKRWQRVARAYHALVEAAGEPAPDLLAAIDAAYEAGETDEFVKPRVIDGYPGMRDGDGLMMANFRADRVRQILAALLDPAFAGFQRDRVVAFAAACGMTDYGDALNDFLITLFPSIELRRTIGELVADAGMTQLRIAETEKYAHVTYFLNGGEEASFPGEDRVLVPSPKVASYDLKPEMSAYGVTDRLLDAVRSGKYDFIVVNYANADMVGHSGNLEAAIKAAEAVDGCLGRLAAAVGEAGAVLFITADHGNAEMMSDPEGGGPRTAHTTSLVPAIVVNTPWPEVSLRDGCLGDVAPTLLQLLHLPKPVEMSGESLLVLGRAETATDARSRASA